MHEEPLPLGDTYAPGGWALHYSASVVATCGPTQRAAAELGGGMSMEDTQDTLREPQTLAPEQLEARSACGTTQVAPQKWYHKSGTTKVAPIKMWRQLRIKMWRGLMLPVIAWVHHKLVNVLIPPYISTAHFQPAYEKKTMNISNDATCIINDVAAEQATSFHDICLYVVASTESLNVNAINAPLSIAANEAPLVTNQPVTMIVIGIHRRLVRDKRLISSSRSST